MPELGAVDSRLFLSRRRCFLLLLGSALVPLWWLIGNELGEFDIWYILFAHAALVVAVSIQLAALWALWYAAGRYRWAQFLSLAIVFGGMALNLNAFGFSTLDLPYWTALILGGMIALGVLLVVCKKADGLLLVTRFSVLLILLALGTGLFKEFGSKYFERSSEHAFLTTIPAPKKNLYVVSFDALISSEAYIEIYGRQRPPPWFAYFREQGFSVITDAQAPADRTLESFGAIFNFGSSDRLANMVGRTYNPVYAFFKGAGYETAFLNETNYFGYARGSLLDYLYPGKLASKTCNFAPENFLYGACRLFKHKVPGGDGPLTLALLNDFKVFMTDRDVRRPWLTVVYVWYPGHSPMENSYQYDGGAQAEKWSTKFTDKTEASVPVIDQVISPILQKDPNAVIAVFGDHGSINYRGNTLPGAPKVPEHKLELDGVGVSMALYPKGLCQDRFKAGYEIRYLFKDLLACGALD